MKLRIKTKLLKDALTKMAKVVPRSSTIPSLLNVKLETKEGALMVQATDLDLWAQVKLELAELEGASLMLLPLTSLRDVLKNCKRDFIEIEHFEEKVFVGPASFDLTTPLEDYPVEPGADEKDEERTTIEDPYDTLKKALCACTADDSRYFLQSINVTPMALQSTDGHRAMVVGNTATIESSFLVSQQMAHLAMLLAKKEASLDISLSNTRVRIKVANWRLTHKRIEETFPNIDKVIPKNKEQLSCSRKELLDALEIVLPFTNKRSHNVKLETNPSGLNISVHNKENASTVEQTVKISTTHEMCPVGINASYLIEPLKVLSNGKVTLTWTMPRTAKEKSEGIKKPLELKAENILYIVMPMRL
jgi:DNA polymerase-3 subunit beta